MKSIKAWIVSVMFIIIILASTGLSVANKETIHYSINPKSVNREIKARGASIVVQELYNSEKSWRAVLRGIAKGNEAWLKISVLLHGASDEGASKMLTLVVGEALEHKPDVVLQIAAKAFGISNTCGGPDIDDERYNSYKLAIKAIDQRIDKVNAINHPSLQKIAHECIINLQHAKESVGQYYGVKRK